MKKQVAILSAIVITVVLVAILLSQISVGDVVNTILSIDPIYFVIGFIVYVCNYFFRALRFHILLNNKISIKDLFPIICVHNMANNILPVRTGELSYVYLSKKLHTIPVGEGIASLVVARIFDFIALVCIVLLITVSIATLPEIISNILWIVSIFLILVVMGIVSLIHFGEHFADVARKIATRSSIKKYRIVQYLLRKIDEVVQALKSASSENLIGIGLCTLGAWTFSYLYLISLMKSMYLPLGFLEMVILVTCLTAMNALPIRSIGGFGTMEGTWTLVLINFHIPLETAITTGFSLHILSLTLTMILGIYGLIVNFYLMKRQKNKIEDNHKGMD